MERFQRRLKVGNNDVLGLDVTEWANGEPITSLSITEETASLVTISSTNISGYELLGNFTGVTAGYAILHFEYETATRSDCTKAKVYIDEGC